MQCIRERTHISHAHHVPSSKHCDDGRKTASVRDLAMLRNTQDVSFTTAETDDRLSFIISKSDGRVRTKRGLLEVHSASVADFGH